MFQVPFVCGATSLGEAARRIGEGAAMIRTKGEAGTGNIIEAVRHFRLIDEAILSLKDADDGTIRTTAEEIHAPFEVVREIAKLQRLPVVNFAAGGLATPADAAMMMQLGVDGVFVGSGIFKSDDPAPRARAIVEATTHFDDPDVIARVSRGLGDAMPGIEISDIPDNERLQERGW